MYIEVLELEGATFPSHKHISGDGGLSPGPGSAEISQHSVWGSDLEHTTRYQSLIKYLQNNYSSRTPYRSKKNHHLKNGPRKSHLTNREHEVPGKDGEVALVKIDWGVSLSSSTSNISHHCIKLKHESLHRGEWEIWLPHPLSRQKNQPLDGEGKISKSWELSTENNRCVLI